MPTSSFPPYITADDLRTSTPEPIKVIRSKKKGTSTGTGKKKRTVTPGEGSGAVTPN
jgi:AP-3 complex subunit delta-1